MRVTLAAAAILFAAPAAAQGGGPGIVPRWPPTWRMNDSTAFMPCNVTGFVDADFAAQFGIADFDWSTGKQLWANAQPMNCEELLAEQAGLVVAASKRLGTSTRVFVYRNLVKALPWFTSVREAMTAPATADAWFLPFKPGGSLPNGEWHVPACDKNYDPPLCSTRYHDQDQTPQHPHGDGSCTAPCDCGGVPCGEYLWNHSAPDLQSYLVNTVVLNPVTGLGNSNISGFYFDDGWANESAAVLPWEPQPNGFCDHSPIGGATEEDFHCAEDMGLVQADTTAIRDAWQANMRAVQEAVIKNGGFAWAYFLQRTTPSNTSTPSQCAAFFRTACAPNASEFTSALFLEYTQPGTYPLVAFEHDLATFLLIRGPFAWMGYAWVGCAVTYDFPAALHLDYGQPSSGQCAETAPGSGVFSRAWSHADVSFDCNTWTPTITMR